MENVLVSLTAGPRNRSRCYVHSTNALKQKHPGILELLLCVRLSFDHNFFFFFFFFVFFKYFELEPQFNGWFAPKNLNIVQKSLFDFHVGMNLHYKLLPLGLSGMLQLKWNHVIMAYNSRKKNIPLQCLIIAICCFPSISILGRSLIEPWNNQLVGFWYR